MVVGRTDILVTGFGDYNGEFFPYATLAFTRKLTPPSPQNGQKDLYPLASTTITTSSSSSSKSAPNRPASSYDLLRA